MKLILILFCFIFLLQAALSALFLPFDVDFYEAEVCEDEGTGELHVAPHIVSHKRNVFTISANISIKDGMTDGTIAFAKVFIWQEEKWKLILHQNFGGICTAFKRYLPGAAKVAFKALRSNGDCPKRGNYTIDKLTVPLKIEGIPLPSYNRFKIEVHLKRATDFVKIGCFTMSLQFFPRKIKSAG